MEGINALVVDPAETFNASVYQQIRPTKGEILDDSVC